ncbi:MAG: M23 family metallopeptidase, partial [Saprospiraceae bacterium]|nr:M23 family metallopeptidase [Saprospiraceae bacterium]
MAQVPPDILNLHSPIAHPIRLSGTYGELRGNHFHGGLDIKSANGVWGDPVFAIDDGYIAEIQISQGGFGRALFIRHPKTGLTSIYGHLQEFTKELNEYVYQQQKDHKSFVLDIPFSENQFPVKRGQLIAKMGSTGYSFGPHLHFELKKTGSDISINPDLYGFFTGDKIKPVIKKIAIYQLDHQLMSYNSSLIAPEAISLHDTMEIDAWRIGLGLEAYDPHNGYNKNGIYAATLILDQDTIYNLVLDSLNARDRNLYNTHIDYKRMVSSHEGIHRCFLLPGTRLSANRHQNTDGIIPLFRDRIQRVTLIASDFAGNETSTIFYLRRSPTVNAPRVLPFQHHFKAGQADSLVTAYLKM